MQTKKNMQDKTKTRTKTKQKQKQDKKQNNLLERRWR